MRDKINACCTNIENADTRESIQKEVDEIRGCCSSFEPETAKEIESCCTNIEKSESKDEIRNEVDKIRGGCSVTTI